MHNSNRSFFIRLSQGHLNLLEACPRKFQHIFFDRLSSPTTPEQQERMAWGDRFHRLMQQRELGLPVDALLNESDPLQHSTLALVRAAPEIFAAKSDRWREAEHYRTLQFQGSLFTVIYDLLIQDDRAAQILDWKTYPLPGNRVKIAANWQTRLYLFVLGETTAYLTEQLSMTYWFVKLPEQPKSLTFSYSRQQHEQTKQDLSELLERLEGYIQDYRDRALPFPQVPEAKGECRFCPFNRRCGRGETQQNTAEIQDWQASIAEIEEVAL
ncbi:PD-(D/E)XK nuclease family protein [Lusitaniella coriacea LEGE 07157]|uniref:PD-(D/E)XK nuclease family protein n=1 Tax=Lusitaniella coriacea LEGE 07157 TaxID=945747 RepID=A0A8J7DUY7_9CYAN|nr:PD-(D/E)XK nuclease family protein [Lusitaniella coriacea]MBE9115175.1 PD-(D/E)XK nuclease family protein [Lusitaniella coriacea LEGE 07157]